MMAEGRGHVNDERPKSAPLTMKSTCGSTAIKSRDIYPDGMQGLPRTDAELDERDEILRPLESQRYRKKEEKGAHLRRRASAT